MPACVCRFSRFPRPQLPDLVDNKLCESRIFLVHPFDDDRVGLRRQPQVVLGDNACVIMVLSFGPRCCLGYGFHWQTLIAGNCSGRVLWVTRRAPPSICGIRVKLLCHDPITKLERHMSSVSTML